MTGENERDKIPLINAVVQKSKPIAFRRNNPNFQVFIEFIEDKIRNKQEEIIRISIPPIANKPGLVQASDYDVQLFLILLLKREIISKLHIPTKVTMVRDEIDTVCSQQMTYLSDEEMRTKLDPHAIADATISFQIDNINGFTEICSTISTITAPLITEAEIEKQRIKNVQDHASNFYITKLGDNFKFEGKILPVSPLADYYKVFNSLYLLIPEGGFVRYEEIAKDIKKSISKIRGFETRKINKFIQEKLGKNNGFLYHSKISNDLLPNGKKLIKVIRVKGIQFNNRKG